MLLTKYIQMDNEKLDNFTAELELTNFDSRTQSIKSKIQNSNGSKSS